MGFLNLFGGGDKKTTTTNTQSSDMRTAVQGSVGSLVSPGAAVAAPGGGAAIASPGATLTQTIRNEGMTGEDVALLLSQYQADRANERATAAGVARSATQAGAAYARDLAEIVAATKAPDSTTIKQLLPLLLLLLLLWFLSKG
jgi:hypothetical protein